MYLKLSSPSHQEVAKFYSREENISLLFIVELMFACKENLVYEI